MPTKDERREREVTTYLSVPEAARLLEVERRTVLRLIDAGKLDAIRFGRGYRIRRASFDRMIQDSAVRRTA